MKKLGRNQLILAIMAVVVIVAAGAGYILSRPQGNELYAAVNITAVSQTEQGVAGDSIFQITSKYALEETQLREMLTIDPVAEYTLTGKGKSWDLTPVAPLQNNMVYTFGVRNIESGETVQSFAFQTKSDLAVNTVYPADESSYVGLDAGIEFTFNAPDVKIDEFFEIKPETAGTFETAGYTAIFKPAQPLMPDSVYRMTLKAGLTAPNGMTLQQDYNVSFETMEEEGGKDYYRNLRLAGEFSETFLTGDPLTVEMASGGESPAGVKYAISVHRYPDLNAYMKELMAYDAFYAERYGKKSDYRVDTAGLEEVAVVDGELLQQGEQWSNVFAVLPDDLPEGHYIATISGKNKNGDEQFVQKMLQVRNLSIYTQSVDGDTLVWLNDPQTGKPMAGVTVHVSDVADVKVSLEGITQEDGTARLMTGKTEEAYLTVMQDGKPTYFERFTLAPESNVPLDENYYAAIYTDRAIYQPTDTVHFWGVIKPRKAIYAAPETAYATLMSGWPEEEVYRVKLDVKPNGTFEGELPYTGLKKDYYSLLITDGLKNEPNEKNNYAYLHNYTATSVKISEYTKPAYIIDVKPDKEFFHVNEEIGFTIRATYFDGTPVAGASLNFNCYEMSGSPQVVTLDAEGKARVTGMYQRNSAAEGLPNWSPSWLWYQVDTYGEEDVNVTKSGSVRILPSTVAAKLTADTPAELTIETAMLDESKLDADGVQPLFYQYDFDQLKGAPVDVPVTVLVHQVEFVQTPIGTYYDYINKRNMTKYKSTRVETVAQTIKTNTVGGKAVISDLPYENTKSKFYWFEARFGGNLAGDVNETFYFFSRWSEVENPIRDRYSYVDTLNNPESNSRIAMNGTFTLGLYRNNIKVKNEGKVLCTAVQRKVLATGFLDGDDMQMTFTEEDMPNVVYAGAYFDGRHVYQIEPYYVTYNYDEKRLNVEIKPDKESYQPGDKAVINLTVTDAQGNPAPANICVGVVDEAVFALEEQSVNIVSELYTSAFFPQISQNVSYVQYNLDMAMANTGGAGGGGGDEPVLRKDFVDTALFKSFTIDATGKGTVELTLPDNTTSWRITGVAVNDELKAGNSFTNAIATLPFYVQPLFTRQYLEGDDIAVALGANGTAVKPDDDVSYTVKIQDAAGVELDQLTASGKAGTRTPLNFGKYAAGQYTLIVSGESGGNADAMQQQFSVIKQGMTIPAIKDMTLEELSGLSSARYPVQIHVYDERMQPYMNALQKLSAQSGERTEVLVGAYRAQVLFNALLDPNDRQEIYKDPRLESIQTDGEAAGIRLLPLSEADAAVTAKMLVAAPDMVKKSFAQSYLQAQLKTSAATPDDRVMAYMGLAALKQPVLIDINRMLANDATLTTAQQLYLGTGLALLGDFTGAQKVYDNIAPSIITEGKLKYIEGDGTPESRLQVTAAALMLTSVTANSDADAFMRFFNAQDADRAKNYKVLTNLEQLTYLQYYIIPANETAAKFTYTADGKQQEVTLGARGFKSFTMGSEALKNAAFQTTAGTVRASVGYTGYADMSTVPTNSKVTVAKTYTPIGGTLATSGRVKVELKVTFAPDAPSGCYHVTDYIPSGMRFINEQQGGGNGDTQWLWSTLENEGQTMRGYIYRDLSEDNELTLVSREGDQVIENIATSENPMDDNGNPIDPNVYTITYYASAALAGEFVTESAYVTPYKEGIAGRSPRGNIVIK